MVPRLPLVLWLSQDPAIDLAVGARISRRETLRKPGGGTCSVSVDVEAVPSPAARGRDPRPDEEDARLTFEVDLHDDGRVDLRVPVRLDLSEPWRQTLLLPAAEPVAAIRVAFVKDEAGEATFYPTELTVGCQPSSSPTQDAGVTGSTAP